MNLNLAEARRLHDRDPNNPARCAICHYIDGDNWPCATAIALGATGRSEWLDTHPDTNHDGPCTCGHVPDGIGFNVTPCTLPMSHTGDHANRTYKWHYTGTGHDGWQISRHRPTDPTPDACGDTNGKYKELQPCLLAPQHWDVHVDRDGNRWEQEPGQ